MTTPSNPDATQQGAPYPGPPYPGQSPYGAQPQPQFPGYGYGPRPKRPYGGALVLAAIGFLIEAAGNFLYWPTDDYSKTEARAAVVCTGVGFLVIAVAAFVALASRPNRF